MIFDPIHRTILYHIIYDSILIDINLKRVVIIFVVCDRDRIWYIQYSYLCVKVEGTNTLVGLHGPTLLLLDNQRTNLHSQIKFVP